MNSSTASLCRRKFGPALAGDTRRGKGSAIVGTTGLCIAARADDPDHPRPDSASESNASGGG